MKRIIITSDMLHFQGIAAYGAAAMVKTAAGFFRQPIALATGLPVHVMHFEETNLFDRNRFYQLCGYPHPSLENWHKLYAGGLSDSAIAYFESCFRDCLFVVQEAGAMRSILERAKLPYVECHISSIRFLEDLHYAFRTNLHEVRERLLQYKLTEYTIRMEADRVRLYYDQQLPLIEIKPRSLLCCGQMEMDQALLKDGRYLSFLDYQEDITALFNRYEHVYFKRHPEAKERQASDDFIFSHRNVKPTNTNFYKLMHSPNILAVAALSSETLNEAPYFGKEAYAISHFHSRHFCGSGAPLPEEWITLREAYFSPAFWADILGATLRTLPCADIRVAARNVVRAITQDNQAYEIGEDDARDVAALQRRLCNMQEASRRIDLLFAEHGKVSIPQGDIRSRLGIVEEMAQIRRHSKALLPARFWSKK